VVQSVFPGEPDRPVHLVSEACNDVHGLARPDLRRCRCERDRLAPLRSPRSGVGQAAHRAHLAGHLRQLHLDGLELRRRAAELVTFAGVVQRPSQHRLRCRRELHALASANLAGRSCGSKPIWAVAASGS